MSVSASSERVKPRAECFRKNICNTFIGSMINDKSDNGDWICNLSISQACRLYPSQYLRAKVPPPESGGDRRGVPNRAAAADSPQQPPYILHSTTYFTYYYTLFTTPISLRKCELKQNSSENVAHCINLTHVSQKIKLQHKARAFIF